MGQNIHFKQKSHIISFPSFLSSCCIYFLSDQFISLYGKFWQIWKGNLQDSVLMPKKEHGDYPLNTSHFCICIFIYFVQWACRSLHNLFIRSSISIVQAAHLQEVCNLVLGFWDTLSAVSAVYICSALCNRNVSCCWLNKEGEGEVYTTLSHSTNSCFMLQTLRLGRSWLNFQKGAGTLTFVK